MYASVPGTYVKVWDNWSGCISTIREFPKSVTLAKRDDVKSTFLAVRSLWMICGLWSCRYTRPLATSSSMEHLTFSGILGTHSRWLSRLPSSRSMSNTGTSHPGRRHKPKNLVMLGWSRLAISLHSWTYFSAKVSAPTLPSWRSALCMIFPAYIRSSTLIYNNIINNYVNRYIIMQLIMIR